ncbi:MAG TPA: coenzyme F420-0:L-glutamate ligase [Actinobacteria bacterium]|nr:coenzyme F420-0:L-glutamate ligase [Actinomycetota bacterium]
MTTWDMTFRALPGIPLIQPGDNLAAIIAKCAEADGLTLADGDVIIAAQKIVSKAEGRLVRLSDITPSTRAQRLAELTGRDARLCQLYLDESAAILGIKGRHIVTIHRLGFQGTGAGVDTSNAGPPGDGYAVLLPKDPDASARYLRAGIGELTGATVAVIVSDSFGSPSREGAFGAAIGIAGIRHLEEPDGEADLFGKPSKPVMNRVDEIASAASILMGQTAAAHPVVIARGVPYTPDDHAELSKLLIGAELPGTDYDLTLSGPA